MQVSQFGTVLLGVALLCALVSSAAGLRPKPTQKGLAIAGASMTASFVTVGAAFALLMSAYAATDLSLLNVYLNSHSLKPLAYKLSGTWGNHEGSLLLWLLILTGFGAAFALLGRGEGALRQRTLGVQAVLATAFLAFTILTSSPFEPYPADWPTPPDGRGLNPLLQDPGLAIHPPTLYVGYVGLSLVYSLTIAALLLGRFDKDWALAVRPFLLVAWAALTLGIGLGGYWAYYELGWGGFWFWDPVENASLMPWLAATALLHCVMVVERRGALRAWCAALAILAFGMSLLGAFLVRSGIVTSVHAFANDPERGVVLLMLSVLFTGGGFVLFALRGSKLVSDAKFEPLSREGALVLNNLLLSIVLFTVFLGTFWPTVVEVATGTRISVGPPYYNTMLAPVAVILAAAMAFGLLLPWKTAGRGVWKKPIAIIGGLAVILGLVFAAPSEGKTLAFLGFTAGLLVIFGTLADLLRQAGLPKAPIGEAARRFASLEARRMASSLSHGGIGLVLIGITASSVFADETRAILRPGESADLAGITLTYEGRMQQAGRNYVTEIDRFVATGPRGAQKRLFPSRRYYPAADQATTEVAIVKWGMGNLYLASAQNRETGDARLIRAYRHPMIHLLWTGVLFLTAGGLLSAFAPKSRRSPKAVRPGERTVTA
jgi:cytochrome c-type biogenesis protein CcmF